MTNQPHYKTDIHTPINGHEVQTMIDNTPNPRDKALIAFLYLTGARPCEAKALYGKDFDPRTEVDDAYFAVRVWTAKRHETGGPESDIRRLEIKREAPTASYFINYGVHIDDNERFFKIGTIRMRQIVWKASEKKRCPYSFRHSRMQKLSDAGASEKELMSWKGAQDLRSVSAYLANKPIGRKLNIT